MSKKQTGKKCSDCVNFTMLDCAARPGINNLRQWPFSNTQCKEFQTPLTHKPNFKLGARLEPVVPVKSKQTKPAFMKIDFWKNK